MRHSKNEARHWVHFHFIFHVFFWGKKEKKILKSSADNSNLFFTAVDFFFLSCKMFDARLWKTNARRCHIQRRLQFDTNSWPPNPRRSDELLTSTYSIIWSDEMLFALFITRRQAMSQLTIKVPNWLTTSWLYWTSSNYGYDYKRTSYTESGISLLRPSMPITPITSLWSIISLNHPHQCLYNHFLAKNLLILKDA